MPREELELVVDVLFDEALVRRRAGEEVPGAMLASMRRLSAALEEPGEPSRFAKWMTFGLKG